jgi:hypothetical protein
MKVEKDVEESTVKELDVAGLNDDGTGIHRSHTPRASVLQPVGQGLSHPRDVEEM